MPDRCATAHAKVPICIDSSADQSGLGAHVVR
jgi:hypothetical protein